MVFNPFDINDTNMDNTLVQSDPDVNFYNKVSCNSLNCDYYFDDVFNEKIMTYKQVDKNFSLFHINLRSLNKNFDSLKCYLELLSIKFSIIAITETWLHENNFTLFQLPGYKFISNHRTGKRGGGVGFYVRNDLDCNIRHEMSLSKDNFESLCIDLNDKLVFVTYRPPNTCVADFNKTIEPILESIKTDKRTCYFTGDFNINLLNAESHDDTSEFLDLMYTFGYVPLITKPTRITDHSATIIDNIIYNDINNLNSYNGILISDLSDHLPIFHIQTLHSQNTENEFIITRNMCKRNTDSFVEMVNSCTWDDVISCTDPKQSFTNFHNKITDMV